MSKQVYLTGITTSGTPHLGNYVGAIRPAIAASREQDKSSFYFLADYHSIIKCQEPDRVARSAAEIAATWLALGLDTDQATFYRQSDIPEILELTWILTCVTAKGLMNRSHAYKAAVDENVRQRENDPDAGVTMGLFSYPVLMAADILMFKAHKVPVGRDQIQHLEMARDIAQRFNHVYGEHFVLPEAVVDEKVAVLAGLDGRKMSKSYNNTIPLWVPEKELRKLIMKIKTDSSAPDEPKDPDASSLFEMYRAFATPEQTAEMRTRYLQGVGWGQVKQALFEVVNEQLAEPRKRYGELMADLGHVQQVLRKGADKARAQAGPFLAAVRKAAGIRALV